MDVINLTFSEIQKWLIPLSLKLMVASLLMSLLACNSNDGLLDGVWVSSKSRTLEEISKTMTLSERHRSIIGNFAGKLKHTVKGDTWLSEFEGQPTKSNFKVLSKDDNCYKLLIDNFQEIKACLYGDELHLPSGIDNILEVFVKSQ